MKLKTTEIHEKRELKKDPKKFAYNRFFEGEKLPVQTIIEEIRLNLHQIYVLREQTVMPIQLEAEIFPADADDKHLTWSADNDLVATVNQRGLVELVGGYGTATVTVQSASGARDQFVVNVVAQLPEGVASEE